MYSFKLHDVQIEYVGQLCASTFELYKMHLSYSVLHPPTHFPSTRSVLTRFLSIIPQMLNLFFFFFFFTYEQIVAYILAPLFFSPQMVVYYAQCYAPCFFPLLVNLGDIFISIHKEQIHF